MNELTSQSPFLLFASDLNDDAMELEGDCACPTWSLQESYPEMRKPLPPDVPLIQIPTQRIALDSQFSMLWPLQKPSDVAILDNHALSIWDMFTAPRALTSGNYDQNPVRYQESMLEVVKRLWHKEFLIDTAIRSVLTPSPAQELVAWIQLTDRCNLECAYCYVQRSNHNMSDTIGRQVIDAIFRSAQVHDYRTVKLKYTGGEPTLNFGLVRNLHEYAIEATLQRGLELHEVLLSNGVALTSTMLGFLKAAAIQLMISLDGLGTEHDARRPLINGTASSGFAQRAIDRALDYDISPHISITVSPANAASLADTVRFVLDRNLPFNLNFERHKKTFPIPRKERGKEAGWEADIIAGILNAFAVIEEKLPKHRLIDGMLDRISFARLRDHPCGIGRDYLAIDTRGRVATCHMTLDKPISDIWRDDPLNAVRRAATESRAAPIENQKNCKTCLWRNVCAGGCPIMAQAATNQDDMLIVYCEVYRAVLPELLRLEGLRLLKWHEDGAI